MPECKYIETCAFLKKYESITGTTIKTIKEMYCNGPKFSECKRYIMLEETHEEPPAELMPNGVNAEKGNMFE